MALRGNPVPRSGERNIYCSFYGDCLDYAVSSLWQCWSCHLCPLMQRSYEPSRYDLAAADPEPHYSLPMQIMKGIDRDTFG
jgi:hypothetical protein